MRCESEVLESDGEFIVYQDRAGYTVRKIIGKSRALEFQDHVTKDRGVWDRVKAGFELDPNERSRMDTKSYFMHLDEYPTWDQAKGQYDALRATGKFVCFTVYGPWEGTWRHRGYSELLLDLMMDPEWVAEMAEAQHGCVLATLRHCIELGMKPDGLFLIEDLAGQQGPLFAPDTWRALFRPCYERLGRYLHDNGISFWMHCCGNCEAFLPDLIECGLDVIQPLQATAGLDVRKLKPVYGDRLAFWGNIDVTKMSGSTEECEAEIRDKLTAAKDGGAYMYHSDHSVPPEVTFERYQWIMELIEQYGES
jgi:uroporphyrinogen decarboxylase